VPYPPVCCVVSAAKLTTKKILPLVRMMTGDKIFFVVKTVLFLYQFQVGTLALALDRNHINAGRQLRQRRV
jgi:hypothetical protein